MPRRRRFYFAGGGVVAGLARGTGVCFSTWLAVAQAASFAANEKPFPRSATRETV